MAAFSKEPEALPWADSCTSMSLLHFGNEKDHAFAALRRVRLKIDWLLPCCQVWRHAEV